MQSEQFKIEGAKEVIKALEDLPVELQKKILKSFIRKAGKKFITDPLRDLIPYKTLKTRAKKQIPQSQFIRIVNDSEDQLSIRAGITSQGYKLRWLDEGTKERKTKKGYNRGSIAGKHQIQPFIDSQIQPIIKYTEDELGNEVSKMLTRKLKKFNRS